MRLPEWFRNNPQGTLQGTNDYGPKAGREGQTARAKSPPEAAVPPMRFLFELRHLRALKNCGRRGRGHSRGGPLCRRESSPAATIFIGLENAAEHIAAAANLPEQVGALGEGFRLGVSSPRKAPSRQQAPLRPLPPLCPPVFTLILFPLCLRVSVVKSLQRVSGARGPRPVRWFFPIAALGRRSMVESLL
jgi:hypothetical protein